MFSLLKTANKFDRPSFRWWKIMHARTVALFLFLTVAMSSRADPFDTLRLSRQTNLINNGSSPLSVANTANGYWTTMKTNSSRTYLWSDLPFGSVSANIVSTYDRLQAMALAWATPGCSLQGNTNLANAVAGGLDWMNTNVYTTNATEYNNWFHWEISGPQSLNDTMVLLYPALTGTQITNYLAAVDRFSPGGPGATYGGMTRSFSTVHGRSRTTKPRPARQAVRFPAGANVAQAFGHDAQAWAIYQCQTHARMFKGTRMILLLREELPRPSGK
jgi:hypothetical protein